MGLIALQQVSLIAHGLALAWGLLHITQHLLRIRSQPQHRRCLDAAEPAGRRPIGRYSLAQGQSAISALSPIAYRPRPSPTAHRCNTPVVHPLRQPTLGGAAG